MDGTQEGWCWETAMAFTPVFLVQPASSTLSAFWTLFNSRVLQGNLLEPFATTLTTLSSDPWAHHPTSNILYALSRPIPRPHELPCVSYTPGQQRHGCRHLDSQARSAQQACATRRCSARAHQRRGHEEKIAQRARCRSIYAHNCLTALIHLLSLAATFLPAKFTRTAFRIANIAATSFFFHALRANPGICFGFSRIKKCTASANMLALVCMRNAFFSVFHTHLRLTECATCQKMKR